MPIGAAKVVDKDISELNEQWNGIAVQCVNNGKYAKYYLINNVAKQTLGIHLRSELGHTEYQVFSYNFNIVTLTDITLNGHFVKLISRNNSEFGFILWVLGFYDEHVL